MFNKLLLPLVLILLGLVFWWSPNFKDIAAGVAILLFGMLSLEKGFKSLTEGPLQKLLSMMTNRYYKSFLFGVISTAILQSSSLISVIAISFLSAGMVQLSQAVAIIFGANVGTTATAWLVASLGLKIKISALAMPILVFGTLLAFQKNKSLKGIGNVLVGLGFIFLGIHFMKLGFDAYKDAVDITQYSMDGVAGLLVYTGLGMLATMILQSSSATMAIILTALAAGQVSYANALALAIGANIGTTITAIIGSIASNAAGKRLAGAHLVFNVITGLIALIFINQFAQLVNYIAVQMNIADTNYTIKLAIFHTLFNLVGVIVMFPFINLLVRFMEKVIKDEKADVLEPKYLSMAAIAFPQSAMSALMKETKFLFDNVFEIVSHGLGLHRREILRKKYGKLNLKPIPRVDIDASYYRNVKTIYGKILEYATLAQEKHANANYINNIDNIKQANRYFVNVVKDIKDLQSNVLKYTNSGNEFIKTEYNELRMRIGKVLRQVIKSQKFEVSDENADKSLKERANHHIEKRKNKLEALLQLTKSGDVLFNGILDDLIRHHKITNEMASSLINDSATVASICKHLIYAAELLYLSEENLLADVPSQHELLSPEYTLN